MSKTPLQKRNELLGNRVVKALEKRHFEAYYCDNKEEALKKVIELIPEDNVVSWGGSTTLAETKILDYVKENYKVIDRDTAKSPEERDELMRKVFFSDTFLMSSNAITEDGQLVNIDGTGNRVAALCFGPKSVIVVAGINKVSKTLQDACSRARNVAAPINSLRFDLETPCQSTGSCFDCISNDSICAYFVTTRICKPAKKIKVIIIGENFGF